MTSIEVNVNEGKTLVSHAYSPRNANNVGSNVSNKTLKIFETTWIRPTQDKMAAVAASGKSVLVEIRVVVVDVEGAIPLPMITWMEAASKYWSRSLLRLSQTNRRVTWNYCRGRPSRAVPSVLGFLPLGNSVTFIPSPFCKAR